MALKNKTDLQWSKGRGSKPLNTFKVFGLVKDVNASNA